jgi:hypothetical protein
MESPFGVDRNYKVLEGEFIELPAEVQSLLGQFVRTA